MPPDLDGLFVVPLRVGKIRRVLEHVFDAIIGVFDPDDRIEMPPPARARRRRRP